MAAGHSWGGASQRVFQPPGAGLAPALPLLISGGEFLAHTYDATYKFSSGSGEDSFGVAIASCSLCAVGRYRVRRSSVNRKF